VESLSSSNTSRFSSALLSDVLASRGWLVQVFEDCRSSMRIGRVSERRSAGRIFRTGHLSAQLG
jgi:hypothetical protein